MNRADARMLADYGRAYGVRVGKSADPRRALKRMWVALSASQRPVARRAIERALAVRGDRKQKPNPVAMLAARSAAVSLAPAVPMPAVARRRFAHADKRAAKAARRHAQRLSAATEADQATTEAAT